MQAAMLELAADNALDHIIIEATGVAEPEELLASFAGPEFADRFVFTPLVTVVDTPKFLKIRDMLGPFFEAQVEKCDYVLLNKIDMVDGARIEAVRQEVAELNPGAVIRHGEHCDVDLDELLDGPESGALQRWGAAHEGAVAAPEHHHHDHHHHDGRDARHAPAESFVVDLAGPVECSAIAAFYAAAPDGLWRSKGFISDASGHYLVQFSMGDIDISPTKPRKRHYLVFIGDRLDRPGIEAAIAATIRTEDT